MKARDVFRISGKEIRELLRDRRALFFSFVLPLLLLPGLLFVTSRVEESARQGAKARVSRVGIAGGAAGLLDRLGRDPDLELIPVPPDPGLLEEGDLDALAVVSPEPASGEPVAVSVYHQGEKPESGEARRRLGRALMEYHQEARRSDERRVWK